jgi:hypothetical protein
MDQLEEQALRVWAKTYSSMSTFSSPNMPGKQKVADEEKQGPEIPAVIPEPFSAIAVQHNFSVIKQMKIPKLSSTSLALKKIPFRNFTICKFHQSSKKMFTAYLSHEFV